MALKLIIFLFTLHYVVLCFALSNGTSTSYFCASSSSGVVVSYEWVEKDKGILSWVMNNTANTVSTFILVRGAIYQDTELIGPYAFGAAYYPAYIYNGLAQYFQGPPVTLQEYQSSGATPLGMVQLDSQQFWTSFVFTLSPGQIFRIEEAGYLYNGDVLIPECQGVYELSYQGTFNFQISYSIAEQCQAFDDVQPCPPSPFSMGSAVYSVPSSSVVSSMFLPSLDDRFQMTFCTSDALFSLASRRKAIPKSTDQRESSALYRKEKCRTSHLGSYHRNPILLIR
ncbi:hypothetical protein Gasu2_44500 [Galdieria sulphuraria]|uniref:Uncharacterized protein n=1 Tax=Galdieria sulphuraria TaxID=130081 RepID=M2Y6L7_GALSU|nr:uncharacterized protein Gasu_11770 [Galdieria sulphuraria]EME31499.1 hypothetical protein Gasu_11770 [Galdieria sulphuraria]GJD10246.1 hypothetical protein Gasu2_44500 [Galdieria sulphuraria]|eukprot:XP_005708019.1 hypothetical protein Gasu_11770 [Galdieria sulphuraria]